MGKIFSDFYFSDRDLRRQKKEHPTVGPEIIAISGFRNNRGQKPADLVISEPRNSEVAALSTSQNWDNLTFAYLFYFILFAHFSPASGQQAVVTGVISSPPRFLPSIFIAHRVHSAIPLLADFSSSVAKSRSRVFRKSICAQEKVPTNLYEYALGGNRTHETDLYKARG